MLSALLRNEMFISTLMNPIGLICGRRHRLLVRSLEQAKPGSTIYVAAQLWIAARKNDGSLYVPTRPFKLPGLLLSQSDSQTGRSRCSDA